jgi:hypothetical protein
MQAVQTPAPIVPASSSTIVPMLGGYSYTQATANTTWTISHGLNTLEPVVDCWVTVGSLTEKILPLVVTATDASTVQITFSTAQSGTAYVV